MLRRVTCAQGLEELVQQIPKHSQDLKIVVWIDDDMSLQEGLSDDECVRLNSLMGQLQSAFPNTLILMTSNKDVDIMEKLPSIQQHGIYMEGSWQFQMFRFT